MCDNVSVCVYSIVRCSNEKLWREETFAVGMFVFREAIAYQITLRGRGRSLRVDCPKHTMQICSEHGWYGYYFFSVYFSSDWWVWVKCVTRWRSIVTITECRGTVTFFSSFSSNGWVCDWSKAFRRKGWDSSLLVVTSFDTKSLPTYPESTIGYKL